MLIIFYIIDIWQVCHVKRVWWRINRTKWLWHKRDIACMKYFEIGCWWHLAVFCSYLYFAVALCWWITDTCSHIILSLESHCKVSMTSMWLNCDLADIKKDWTLMNDRWGKTFSHALIISFSLRGLGATSSDRGSPFNQFACHVYLLLTALTLSTSKLFDRVNEPWKP